MPAKAGAVPQTDVKIGENGSTNDTGDLNLKSVSEVAGRIHLSDGKPIPANSHYFLSDAAMGNSLQSFVGSDGSFQFAAVPGDKISIYLRVSGYQLTPREAQGLLQSVLAASEVKSQKRVTRHITEAINQINVALSIR